MTGSTDRRDVLAGLGAFAAAFGSRTGSGRAQSMRDSADLILFNGKITTLDRQIRMQLQLPLRMAGLLLSEAIPTFFSERPRMCNVSI